ncbi:MAG: hypothetical protein JWM76_4442 [Pseudonocardiales bacterium]|jgi:hypothetical protein|nr:hypothetical protein [Pseudonocardiales bacterium]
MYTAPLEGVAHMSMTTLTDRELIAADRCDRCGAQAHVRVLFASGGELLFCAHHARAHEARLRELDAAIQDDTNRLEATPAVAAADER